jgi:Domain of unknown function (DUF4399)
MHLRNLTDVRPHDFNSFICLLVVGIATCGTVIAQDHPTGGPTPSPPGAEAYFVDIKDGQHLPVKAVIHFGLRNMGVAPAGVDKPNTGHHHLLIDAELPPLDKPIPNDFNHLHFGAGQTETELKLNPGEHSLQLLMGDKDHIPHTPPVMSQRIRVFVDAPAAVAASSESAAPTFKRKSSPAGARVYFIGLSDDSVLSPNPIIRFGLTGMGVAPAGVDKPNTGHHHLLIDASPLDMDRPIPNDFNHLHFGAGQTEAKVELPLGWHRLQLVLGDENHMPFDPPVMSEQIKVLVTATDQRPVRHRSPRSSKR